MEIASAIGGIPPLTAAVVVCTGIFGGMAGFGIVRMSRIQQSYCIRTVYWHGGSCCRYFGGNGA